MREWIAKNPKEKEARRNRARLRESSLPAEIRAERRKIKVAKVKDWQARNRDRHLASARESSSARRAKFMAAIPAEFGEFDKLVISEAVAACKRRQAMTGYRWEVDHMVPLARGGKHAWWNIQVIPRSLNRAKHDNLELTKPGEWIGLLPGA